jgi:lipopolysaccharide transport protein LptA
MRFFLFFIILILFFSLPSYSNGEGVGAGASKKASSVKPDSDKKPGKAPVKVVVKITSKTLEADTLKRWVKFKGDVVFEDDYLLCADELFLSYEDDKKIKKITADGNVRIIYGTKRARGESAVYDKKNRSIIITGKAVVSECRERVSGDKITLYLDKESIIVDSGKNVDNVKKSRARVVLMPHKECIEVEESEEFFCKRPR